MKMKKLISFLCAAALTVSSFAGLAVTASAETPKSVTVAVDAGDTTANVTTTESSAVTGVLLLAKYSNNALTSLKVSPSFTTPANDVALGAAYADGDKLMAWEDLASMKPITVTRVAKPVPKTAVNTVAELAVTATNNSKAPATITAAVTAKQGAEFTDTNAFTYTWTKDGVDANTTGAIIENAAAGTYTVTATYNGTGNYEGSLGPATITITAADETRTNLSGATVALDKQTATVGDTVTATVTIGDEDTDITDSADLTYQWYKAGETPTAVQGATAKTYTTTEAGTFYVVVSAAQASTTYIGTKNSGNVVVSEPVQAEPYVSGTAPAGATIRAVSVNVDDDSKTLTYKQLVEGEVKTTENTKEGADHNETYAEGSLLAQKNSSGESPVIVRVDKGDLDLTGKKAYIKFTAKTNFGSSNLTLSTATAPSTDDIAALTGATKPATGTQLKKWSNSANTTDEVEITSLFNDASVVWFVINSESIRIQNITNLEFVVKAPHNVTVDSNITGGTITPDKATALQGETVTLTVTPATGKELQADSLKVNNGAVTVEAVGLDYRFTMPDTDVTITATFIDEAIPKYAVNLAGVPGYAQVYTSTDGVTYTTKPVARTNHLGQIIQLGDGETDPVAVDATNILIARQPNGSTVYYKITKSGYPDKTGSVTPNGAAATIDASSMAPTAANVLYSEDGDWNLKDNVSTMGGGTCRSTKSGWQRIRWQNSNAVVTLNTDSLTVDKYALKLSGNGWGSWQAKESTYSFKDAADKTLATMKFTGTATWNEATAIEIKVGSTTETITPTAPATYTATNDIELTVDKTTGAVTLKYGDTTVSGTVADAGMVKTITVGTANLSMFTSLITVSTYTPVTPAAKTITWANTLTGFTVKKGSSAIDSGATLAANDVITIEATAADKKVKSVTATGATFTVTDGVASATVGATPADIVITAVELEDKTTTPAASATVSAATIHDTRNESTDEATKAAAIADNDLATGYAVTENNGAVTVNATNLEEHQNGNTPATMGYWVGVKFTLENVTAGAKVYYKALAEAPANAAALKATADVGEGALDADDIANGWSIYTNAAKYQTGGDRAGQKLYVAIEGIDKLYAIDFSQVTLYTAATPAATVSTATVTTSTSETPWKGHSPNELGTFTVKSTEEEGYDYELVGTANYIADYSQAFGTEDGVDMTKGYYIPFSIDIPDTVADPTKAVLTYKGTSKN